MKSVIKYFGITNGQMENFFNENREKREREREKCASQING
jgi:hypothetical protein